MHPLQQVGIIGPVVAAVGSLTPHAPVDAPDFVDCALGVSGGAERGDRQERAGALESSPGIAAVIGMLGDSGHGQRVQRLQQQGAQPPDEHRGIGVHPTNGPVVGEPPRARSVVDPAPVLRALGTGNHGEQAPSEPFPHVVEVQVQVQRQRHTPTVRGCGRNDGQGSRSGGLVTALG